MLRKFIAGLMALIFLTGTMTMSGAYAATQGQPFQELDKRITALEENSPQSDSFFDVFTELGFTVESFFDVFTELQDSAARSDSFFDVFFDVFPDAPDKSGIDSFFDVFTELRATDSSLQTQIDSFENQDCDDGYYVSGIDDNGQIKCKPLLSDSNSVCGDNIVTAPETCDDGDTISGDGCNATCQVESGFSCVGSPSVCSAVCNADTNPLCNAYLTIPSVSGDIGNDYRVITGNSENWYRLTIREDSSGFGEAPESFILLEPSNGDNYDLFVYCETCGGTPIVSSTFPSDLDDFVSVQSFDDSIFGDDDTFNVLIEVRAISVNSCSDYTLTVQGNVISGEYGDLGLC